MTDDCFFVYFLSDQTDDNSINDLDASRPVQVPDTVPEQQNEVCLTLKILSTNIYL